MKAYDRKDRLILETASRLFAEKGVQTTEMKDIAEAIGCSRSTLYRHFSSKESILMVLAENAIQELIRAQKIPEEYRFTKGYDAFAWQLNAFTDALITNVQSVAFLRDFDSLYSTSYPEVEESAHYVKDVLSATKNSPLRESYESGVLDGSIRPFDNPDLGLLAIYNSCIALAERIMPREKMYIAQLGYGQEILRYHVDWILKNMKA